MEEEEDSAVVPVLVLGRRTCRRVGSEGEGEGGGRLASGMVWLRWGVDPTLEVLADFR